MTVVAAPITNDPSVDHSIVIIPVTEVLATHKLVQLLVHPVPLDREIGHRLQRQVLWSHE